MPFLQPQGKVRPPADFRFSVKLARARKISSASSPSTALRALDNTTFGFATLNALELIVLLDGLHRERKVS